MHGDPIVVTDARLAVRSDRRSQDGVKVVRVDAVYGGGGQRPFQHG